MSKTLPDHKGLLRRLETMGERCQALERELNIREAMLKNYREAEEKWKKAEQLNQQIFQGQMQKMNSELQDLKAEVERLRRKHGDFD